MTAVESPTDTTARVGELADALVRWFETGARTPGLFSAEVLTDLTVPQWRLQTTGEEGTYRLRERQHPYPGTVRVERLESTEHGLLLQFEERWTDGGRHWYCRELLYATITEGAISELVVYCTGDWDEAQQQRHAREVTLVKP